MINIALVHYEVASGIWNSAAYKHLPFKTTYYSDKPIAVNKGAEGLDTSRVFIKMLLKEEYKEYKITREVIQYENSLP